MMPPGSRCANGREGGAIVKRIDIDFCSGQQTSVKWASHSQLSSPAPGALDRPVKPGDDTGEQSCSKIPIASGDGCFLCFCRQFAEALRARERQMAELPRLNNVIRAWEEGKPAFTSFAQAEVETAVAMSTSKFDGVVYEMEHNFWDAR